MTIILPKINRHQGYKVVKVRTKEENSRNRFQILELSKDYKTSIVSMLKENNYQTSFDYERLISTGLKPYHYISL